MLIKSDKTKFIFKRKKKHLPSIIRSKSLPISAASSYTSSTVKFVNCCRIGEHVIVRISFIGVDDSWLLGVGVDREKLPVVCERRSGVCSIDDDEGRSNQMIVISK
jgi:hypothetical protein